MFNYAHTVSQTRGYNGEAVQKFHVIGIIDLYLSAAAIHAFGQIFIENIDEESQPQSTNQLVSLPANI